MQNGKLLTFLINIDKKKTHIEVDHITPSTSGGTRESSWNLGDSMRALPNWYLWVSPEPLSFVNFLSLSMTIGGLVVLN